MTDIKLELAAEEIDVVLGALGEQPFIKVAGIIEKIRGQAVPQWNAIQESQNAPKE